MKKHTSSFLIKYAVGLCILSLFFTAQTANAQNNGLRKDTAYSRFNITSRNNINANLKKIDATPPAVYKINPLGTAIVGVVATAANMIAINNFLHNKQDISVAEVQAAQAVNRNSFNVLDRWALNLDPSKRDHFYSLSDKALTGVFVISAASFVIDKATRKDWLRLGLMFYQTQFITFAFYDFSPFGPLFQNKLRPFVYYSYFPIDERRQGNQKNSFYSGHVANATSATFFAVKVYCDYHPEIGGRKYLLYGLASIPPLVTGWLRVKALAHFPSDALAGYLIGGAFGILIPELHKVSNSRLRMNTFYNGQNGGLSLCWNFNDNKKS